MRHFCKECLLIALVACCWFLAFHAVWSCCRHIRSEQIEQDSQWAPAAFSNAPSVTMQDVRKKHLENIRGISPPYAPKSSEVFVDAWPNVPRPPGLPPPGSLDVWPHLELIDEYKEFQGGIRMRQGLSDKASVAFGRAAIQLLDLKTNKRGLILTQAGEKTPSGLSHALEALKETVAVAHPNEAVDETPEGSTAVYLDKLRITATEVICDNCRHLIEVDRLEGEKDFSRGDDGIWVRAWVLIDKPRLAAAGIQ